MNWNGLARDSGGTGLSKYSRLCRVGTMNGVEIRDIVHCREQATGTQSKRRKTEAGDTDAIAQTSPIGMGLD